MFLLLLLACVLTFVAYDNILKRWQQPLNIPASGMTVVVNKGDTLTSIVNGLRERGVVEHPKLVLLYGRWTGLDQQIKRGEYSIPAHTTAESLLNSLSEGRVVQYQLTLPEGITLQRALEILHAEPTLQHLIQDTADSRLRNLMQPHSSPEGLFLPETYRFERGDTDWQILQRAHKAMLEVLGQEWEARSRTVPYETQYEALIMASIIERETGVPRERAEIAGVFVRRLHKRMLLQTDPTVIYGLGSTFNGNLRRKHLTDVGNPYNTYRHRGLPPTPIALPGRAAIHAALNPDSGKSLYFVATGDGAHKFSATLAEHNAAVRKYQLQRKKGYRSSPSKQN